MFRRILFPTLASVLAGLLVLAVLAGRAVPADDVPPALKAKVKQLVSLPDDADKMTTADGRDKTVAASRARLARMVGRDADE